MGRAMNKRVETSRVLSIDALRGADMLLLAGGGFLLQAFFQWSGQETLTRQLTHAAWGESLTCWDMVMPLFIFIVGAGMPFAFEKYRSRGRAFTVVRIVRRCVLLFVLGMLVQGRLATADPSKMSLFCNTLQAIAEGYFIAALCLLFGGVRAQLVTCVACLVSYWAALRFIPYAGHEPGLFLPHDNLAIWIDHCLQGRWQDGTPYSWILTSLSFGALTLMGVLAGQVLRLFRRGWRSLAVLTGAGMGCLLAGQLLSWDTPIIKHIYTASAVLWCGGWCFLLMAAFHAVFDCCSRLGFLLFPLQVVGCNAMLAYLITQTPGIQGSLWSDFCHPLFGGVASHAGAASTVCFAFLSLTALWCLLLFLYRRKVFIRV